MNDNQSTARQYFSVGAISAALGIAAGTFGAHRLKNHLPPEMLVIFETAVRYQMYHAFALLATALGSTILPSTKQNGYRVAGWCFLAGTLLFSGSLYVLALTAQKWLGAITPLGGVAFLLGWSTLAWTVTRRT
jgi:uncharacterized membrane protein YgdD (TMEM256/DUF423 family)